MKKLKLFIFLLLIGIFANSQNILVTDNVAILPGTGASDGLFQINRSSSLGLDIINRTALNLNVTNEMGFNTGGLWTGSIKTIGNNATDARLAFFTGTNATRGNLIERLSINNNGNFALNFGTAVGNEGYLNFGTAFGLGGFGIRSNAGRMEYRHNTDGVGVWTPFPPGPPVGTSVEWWLRLTAGSYIYPQYNSNIRVYDPGQTYGIYYDGATNQYGLYSRTSSAMATTAAVVGFSDITGFQTYGYLGYAGPWATVVYPGRTFSLSGMGVYGMVDDPARAAIFSRTTSNATTAALCSYSDVWIAGFFEAKDSSSVWNTRPSIYGQLTTKISKAGNSDAIRGLSYYYPAAGNLGYTIGLAGYSISQSQTGYGVYTRHYTDMVGTGTIIAILAGHDMTSGLNFGAYAQRTTNEYGYIGYNQTWANYFYHSESVLTDGQATLYGFRTRTAQNDGTGYGITTSNAGLLGYSYWGDLYSFGTSGFNYNDYTRCGGILGADMGGIYWGSLGYKSSGSLTYGGYFTSHIDGAGMMVDPVSDIGLASYGGFAGSWVRGEVYGMIVKGDRMGLYVDGKTITNNITVQMNDNGTNDRIPTYVPTSTTVDIIMKGTSQLINGKAIVMFDEKYLNLISTTDPIIITVTPVGKTNGVYIEETKSNGFTISENNDGISNATFNWIAIATKKGYENPEVPVELLSNQYDNHLKGYMFNENNKGTNGEAMWWDGTQIRFDGLPIINFVKEKQDLYNIKPSIIDPTLEKNKNLNKSLFQNLNQN